jgi:hypothetical protein
MAARSALSELKNPADAPIIGAMSIESAMLRVAELHAAAARVANPMEAATGGTQAPAGPAGTSGFQAALQGAMGTGAPLATTAAAGMPFGVGAAAPVSGARSPGAAAALAAAQGEVGQAEMPPGSNNSPRIAMYRSATPGAIAGAPWCAYFASWAARQGGVPLGDQGQGFGSVDAVWAWAQRTGRAMPASAGTPAPGDLIVWNEHIGIVEGLLPDGRIQTIEGNSSDQVSRRIHPAGDAIGYVRLG